MNLVGQQLGPFYIFEEVRRGVSTRVFHAIDVRVDEDVALSVLPPYFAHNEQLAQRFVEAGRHASRLRHQRIWPVLDADRVGDLPYIVRTWVEGETLAARMRRIGGPAPVDVVSGVVAQMSEALDHLHGQDIAHGAINPTNVFLTRDGRSLLTNIAFPNAARRVSLVPGSGSPDLLAFLAPEQATGDLDGSAAADRYSLSAIAYFLLTGRPPFVAENPFVLLRQTVDEPPTPITVLRPDISVDAIRVVSRGLDKNPTHRFHSATELSQALASVAQQHAGQNGYSRNGHAASSKSAVMQPPGGADTLVDTDASPANRVVEVPRRGGRRGRRGAREQRPDAGRRLVFNMVITLLNLLIIAAVATALIAPNILSFNRGETPERFRMEAPNSLSVEDTSYVVDAVPAASATPDSAVLPPTVADEAAPLPATQ